MLRFDSKGNLKPYTAIACTVAQMKATFVDSIPSSTRFYNFERYIKYSNELKVLLGGKVLKQWINGSFVTKKLNPKDVDVVTFVDHQDVENNKPAIHDFMFDNSWKMYGVDGYIVTVFPRNMIREYEGTEAGIEYWSKWFGFGRLKKNGEYHKKGFLEILY